MANIAFGQENTLSASTSGTPSTASFTAKTFNLNDAIVVWIGWKGTNTLSSVTDNQGNTYTHVTGFPATALSGSNQINWDCWVAVGLKSGATTVKITMSAATTIRAEYSTYSGVATSSAIETQAKNSGSSTVTTGAVTPASTNQAVMVGGAYNTAAYGYSGLTNAGTGGTSGLTQLTSVDNDSIEAYQIVPGPDGVSTYNDQWNSLGGNSWAAGIVVLKGGAPAVNVNLSQNVAVTTSPKPAVSPTPGVKDSVATSIAVASQSLSATLAFAINAMLAVASQAVSATGAIKLALSRTLGPVSEALSPALAFALKGLIGIASQGVSATGAVTIALSRSLNVAAHAVSATLAFAITGLIGVASQSVSATAAVKLALSRALGVTSQGISATLAFALEVTLAVASQALSATAAVTLALSRALSVTSQGVSATLAFAVTGLIGVVSQAVSATAAVTAPLSRTLSVASEAVLTTVSIISGGTQVAVSAAIAVASQAVSATAAVGLISFRNIGDTLIRVLGCELGAWLDEGGCVPGGVISSFRRKPEGG